MAFHREVMSPAQQRTLRRIGPLATGLDFHLGGGTAVAIHLGHRRSLDLHWFTSGELAEPLALAGELRDSGETFEVTGVEEGTLHGAMDGVRLSFLEYRYKRDFVDLYAIGRTRLTLERMLDLYRRKFEVRDVGHTIMALTYFDDAEEEAMPDMLWEVEWEEIGRTIESWVRSYVRRQAPPRRKGGGPPR